MHFQMRIQPYESPSPAPESDPAPATVTVKPVVKSRLKRLFDRQFLKNTSEKVNVKADSDVKDVKDVDFEPSSVCLAKMVQNFIEDNTSASEKPKCGRNRCNCFNGNVNDVSDDETDLLSEDCSESLKSLIPCGSVIQRNLLADVSKIVEKSKTCKRKGELRKLVAEGLVLSGYDASICRSHWEKSSSCPAGDYEYIDVVFETGERVLVDVDFRSEFEIARPTGSYKAILQSLPYVFVGEADRVQQIVSIVTEAAKLSLKKRGMHVPPWRKFEYTRSKWLAAYIRTPTAPSVFLLPPPTPPPTPVANEASKHVSEFELESECGVFELVLGEETTPCQVNEPSQILTENLLLGKSDDGFDSPTGGKWELPAVKPRNNVERGSKLVVTGLASLFKEKA